MIFPISVNISIAIIGIETESIETLMQFIFIINIDRKHSLYYFNSQV